MKAILKYILMRDSTLMTRMGLAVGSLLWSIQLALPIELFPPAAQLAVGKGRTTYSIMAVVPENVWAILFLIHAIWSLYTILTGVRNVVTLAADGVLGCILWTGSTLACFAAYWPHELPFLDALAHYPPPAAMSGEVVMALFSWWHMIRFWAIEETHQTLGDKHG